MASLRSSMAESELLDVHLKRSVQDEGSQRGQDKVAVLPFSGEGWQADSLLLKLVLEFINL